MPMLDTKRPTCGTCLRPQRACICRWIAPASNIAEVLILQHPLEAGEAKGSARLLQLSLVNIWLAVGESFAEDTLQALLHAPFESQDGNAADMKNARQPVLLYPTQTDCPTSAIIPQHPEQIRLIVLDGTWRKTRKMLHLNPLLQQVPRLPLTNPPPSHYLIRKAHRTDQLSTLEATCHALTQLENAPTRYVPLLRAFDGFVAQQQACIPRYTGADERTDKR
jgi:DTW domain-containing protein YfiP